MLLICLMCFASFPVEAILEQQPLLWFSGQSTANGLGKTGRNGRLNNRRPQQTCRPRVASLASSKWRENIAVWTKDMKHISQIGVQTCQNMYCICLSPLEMMRTYFQ